MSKSTISSDPQNKAAENGIANTSGALIAAFAPLYLAGVPLTSYLTSPNGILERTVHTLLDISIPGGTIPHDRLIPAISALYVFFTFGATGAFSAAGQAMARPTGLDNRNPRESLHQLRGLPNRLRSAHYNLLENFSGFALAAGLTQTLAPTNAQLINLLGLHAPGQNVCLLSCVFAGRPATEDVGACPGDECVDQCALEVGFGREMSEF
ncbi:hypothetical protein LTR41_002603 [Exophiala xenobiotica]|nr:hypothetical protein LTR41_002603 [Exophiala xenobiotica]